MSNPLTKHVQVSDGQIGYQIYTPTTIPVATIICLPGMADVAHLEYSLLVPQLLQANYCVITADLRGNGLSAGTQFRSYTVATMTSDLLAVLDAEGIDTCFIAANSISGCSAGLLSIQTPTRVLGLVLLAPIFDSGPAVVRVIMSALLRLPFGLGVSMWIPYFRLLYPLHPVEETYVAESRTNLKRAGGIQALSGMSRVRHLDERVAEIKVPAIVFLGTKDVDFGDVQKEAKRLQTKMPQAEVITLEGVGHYPHREVAEEVGSQIVEWLNRISRA
ncbi:Alpha/Beta hydrolase protein [Jimgerdemannia flammicorona]|uniref:Alpha/Beta hydrolase protein n=1 Tax=Jimgerdemannia flammicorona TaxID=994334 RepID=A0A433Q9J0_9FUNG|nr:Alpha/Beta hydrolase protein [Jimgerdemannia flammicorona]